MQMATSEHKKRHEFDLVCSNFRHGRLDEAKRVLSGLDDEEIEEMHLYFLNELNDHQLSFEVRKKLQ